MNVLFLGDVVGRTGRDAIEKNLIGLRLKWQIDFVILNGENASAGFGLSAQHAEKFLNCGVDCITLGDHAFDQADMVKFIENESRIIRPLNFAKSAPGRGSKIFDVNKGKKILVAQVLGQVFMKRPFSEPFSYLDKELEKYRMGTNVDAIVIDVHAEATSEKMAIGHWCDGRASLVVGTHTHVPTADTKILSNGTAYQTDAGMCGDYDSVIGMEKQEPIRRFVTGMPKERFVPAKNEATLCGVLVRTNLDGKAKEVFPFRCGGDLLQSTP